MLKERPSTRFVTPHSAAQCWPRRTGMSSAFTAFVRSQQGERTPDAALFHDTWHGLRAALAREMKKRGLWQSPPCYLGAFGWESWDSEGQRGVATDRAQGALAELVADCYAFIFVDRLESLKRQLEDKPEIDGLVLLNIRHFLLERQLAHYPLGFRVYELLHAAVEEAVSSGALHCLAGDKKVRNDTLLGFDPEIETPSPPCVLEPIVFRWSSELMPELITARTRQQAAVARQLRDRLLGLPQHGVKAFRFKDLLDPFKRDVRQRWAVLLEEEEQGGAASPLKEAAKFPVPTQTESQESLEHLRRSISTSIDRAVPDSRTRSQLKTLWNHLWRQHGDEDGEAGQTEPSSHRQLSQCLKIPRERLPLLFHLLRQLVLPARIY